ncbi:histidine kinase [Streptomyces sp. CB01881]|uniref:sensor histidine kinase n=1 Tax=Streptomyces sp. CB01881 TaxID=2078691 RepID=UPI000CDBD5A5|nr:histidine kinase [Streptomyces sp. CB01881]AUY50878.1 histidine kinase [Streptomyces sp. CB01881]TYC74260.1 sensor histidine kinase [Streptomyces sp. CB01881]
MRLLLRSHAGHLMVLDFGAAVVITLAYGSLAGAEPVDGLPVFGGPAWLGWLVAAGVGMPLAVRRRRPLPVLAVVLLSSVAATLLDITRDPFVATALACYPVALLEPARRSAVAMVVTLAASAAAVLLGEAVVTPAGSWTEAGATAASVCLAVGLGWVVGRWVRERRALAAEQGRVLADQALADERLRISRELHDIVSHSLSTIVVKASIANHVAAARPEEAHDTLRVIEQTGREALAEMRRALGVLRDDAGAAAESASLAPAPGLADLPQLVRRAEQAGVRARLRVRAPGYLPAGMELAVYRIVQEALTNVVKHSGAGTRCQVSVGTGTAGEILIDVLDHGPPSWAPAPDRTGLTGGHGLLGMRERVLMYGGSLTAEPRAGGGFVVSARLPHPRQGAPA